MILRVLNTRRFCIRTYLCNQYFPVIPLNSFTRHFSNATYTDDSNFPSDIEQEKLDNAWVRDQRKHSYRPNINPQETSIVLFPGQGTQFVGMGKQLLEYPGVKEIYKTANDILGYDLLDLCMRGPQNKLTKTIYSQPAIFVASIAAVEKLKHIDPRAIEECITSVGYSIGEYAALVFTGAMSFEDALKVVQVRAHAMQKASEEVHSGMMTVTLTPQHKIRHACDMAQQYCQKEHGIEGAVCSIASHLYTEAKVIAGNEQALKFIEANKDNFGIRSIKHIPVSGAFHTKLMKSARKPLEHVLSKVKIRRPIAVVHSNVTSYKYTNPRQIPDLLERQIVYPVKWEQIMHTLLTRPDGEHFPNIYEVGPGKQLGYFIKHINRKAMKSYRSVDV